MNFHVPTRRRRKRGEGCVLGAANPFAKAGQPEPSSLLASSCTRGAERKKNVLSSLRVSSWKNLEFGMTSSLQQLLEGSCELVPDLATTPGSSCGAAGTGSRERIAVDLGNLLLPLGDLAVDVFEAARRARRWAGADRSDRAVTTKGRTPSNWQRQRNAFTAPGKSETTR